MSNKVIQALKNALAAMNDSGAHWVQGTLRDYPEFDLNPEPRYCSLGAVYLVTGADLDTIIADEDSEAANTGDLELRKEVVALLANTIPDEEIPELPSGVMMTRAGDDETHNQNQWRITTWNDSDLREWPEIVALFERAQQQAEGAPTN